MKILKRIGGKIWLGIPGTAGIELVLSPELKAELDTQGITIPPDGYDGAVAMGTNSQALGNGVAVGAGAFANHNGVAIGQGAKAGSNSVSIGCGAGGNLFSDK